MCVSDIFSKQRCMYPIWVSARAMRSPSIRAIRCTMPWVAGCDGPIESVCVSKCPARSSVFFAQSGQRRSSSAKNQRCPGE
ncbi:MAG: hypothetical protein LC780_12245 [Acidobacteria bacterium]|nr:hypothetical protein [Acidobacteriota bacterium]